MENIMELKILSLPENEAFARSTVAAFCLSLEPTISEINDIKTAVSEAVTNSIVHGYRDSKTGIIDIKVKTKNKLCEVTISDHGVGIEDIKRAFEPFFTTKPNEERSGMGFTIMQSFMDSVEVSSDHTGTVVKMTKKFGEEQAVVNA